MTALTSQEAEPGLMHPRQPKSSVCLDVSHTLLLTKRLLSRWSRDYVAVAAALVFPILLMVVLDIVLGNLAYAVTHDNALYGIVPLVSLGSAIAGSTFVALDLMRERSCGLLSRLWVLPVQRATGVLSRILANVIRILFTTLVMLGTGAILGFRFRQGVIPSLAWLSVPIMLGIGFAVIATTVALYTVQTVVVVVIELTQVTAIFFSTGLVPLDQYPRWIQPAVAHQPVSYAIASMRGLSMGGPVLSPVIALLLWTLGICAACALPLAIGYRRASTQRA